MNWTVSIIVCAVCLVIWVAATIAEHKLVKKRTSEKKRSEVYYGRNNDQRHDYRNQH